MLIEFSEARCGAGKTRSVLHLMASQRGRYVYAVDRREVIEERTQIIRDVAAQHGLAPVLQEIVSTTGKHDATAHDSVATRIGEAPDEYGVLDHCVLVITHAGMMMADHGRFEGWTIVIDEDPAAFKCTTFADAFAAPLFRDYFEIVDGHDQPNRILATPAAPSVDDFRRSASGNVYTELRRLSQDGRAMTTESDWTALSAGRRVSWFALWTFDALAAYDRRVIVANAFTERLNYRVHRELAPHVHFRPLPLDGIPPEWEGRDVTIRYFADDHSASASFFASDEGAKHRATVAKWLASEYAGRDDHFWTANNAFKAGAKIAGKAISPKVAGLNDFRAYSACSILYSAKASSAEISALAALCGLVTEDARAVVARDREQEDLVQFALRSSLRDPANGQAVTVNVYDRSQAEFLSDFLQRNGYGCKGRVTVEHVDLGLSRTVVKRGRPESGKAMTAAERKAKSRAAKKARNSRA